MKEGKPKSKHRLEMENRWMNQGGFESKRLRQSFWVRDGTAADMDEFGV